MTETKKCNGECCIFCNSKCPECGSLNIRVKFKPVFEYENDAENKIVLTTAYSNEELTLECDDCEETFEFGEWEQDDRLWPLIKALKNSLEIPYELKITHDSETDRIETEPMYVGSPD